MHSSTSSFSQAPLSECPVRSLLIGIFAFLVICLVTEHFWRELGHNPTISDTKEFWAWHRRHANVPQALVLIGTSRGQCGFDHDALRSAFPEKRLIQLCVAANSPVATLRDFANDQAFRGDILCDISEPFIEKRQWHEQQPYIDYYRNQPTPLPFAEAAVTSWLECQFAFMSAKLKPREIMKSVFERRSWPTPDIRIVDFRRFRQMKITAGTVDGELPRLLSKLTHQLGTQQHSPDDWQRDVKELAKVVHSLTTRGCRVVFIRFPTSGPRVEIDETAFPRKFFWDVFTREIGAPCVHFLDYSPMESITCPDMSHMTPESARLFTTELLNTLKNDLAVNLE